MKYYWWWRTLCFSMDTFSFSVEPHFFPFLYTSRVTVPHMFSVRFKSWLKHGKFKTLAFLPQRHCFILCELCIEALSCKLSTQDPLRYHQIGIYVVLLFSEYFLKFCFQSRKLYCYFSFVLSGYKLLHFFSFLLVKIICQLLITVNLLVKFLIICRLQEFLGTFLVKGTWSFFKILSPFGF